MCRTAHAVLQTVICGIQMLVRVFMTIILMIENLIRMILQTLYNFISFLLQMISLIPICFVFLLTARLKCFMCGGGGPCPVNRGGTCDCLMSAMAIVILFLIFRATGVLDKIFYKIGYVKARPLAFTRFVPTPGDITECSRNDTDYDSEPTTEMWPLGKARDDDSGKFSPPALPNTDSEESSLPALPNTDSEESSPPGLFNTDSGESSPPALLTTDSGESTPPALPNTDSPSMRRGFLKFKNGKTQASLDLDETSTQTWLLEEYTSTNSWTTVMYYVV